MQSTLSFALFSSFALVFSGFSAGSAIRPRDTSLAARCNPSDLILPKFDSIQILDVAATYAEGATFPALNLPVFTGSIPAISGLNFCNATITYTHPGWNDTIHVNILLPLSWNGRYLATGGGGWIAGSALIRQAFMQAGELQSYAVAYTDAGHSETGTPTISDPWTLTSPGNLNWPLLVDFGSDALHELAIVGKAIVQAYYERPAQYSYWYGSSQGGRQGHMLAQRYPEDFNGLVAHFPAIYWTRFFSSMRWPVFVMDKFGVYPPPCEIDAFTFAAIKQCDKLDGVKDGIVSHPWACKFEPESIVGTEIQCTGFNKTVSSEAASIMRSIWQGPRSSTGEFQWYGYDKSANLTTASQGIALNECDAQGENCAPVLWPLGFEWNSWVVKRNPDYTGRNISHQEWDDNFLDSLNQFRSIIETDDDDLSRFKKAGTKLINWHGTRDPLIPYNGSSQYYDRLLERDPETSNYYRLFTAPAATHGYREGLAPTINGTLGQLIEWVERGIAPETLSGQGLTPEGATLNRELCLYPRVQHYIGGDVAIASSYICV